MAKLTRRPTTARNLDAYRVTLEWIAFINTLLPRITRVDAKQATQLKDANRSVLQHLSEGMRRTGADRAHMFTVSLGSADEVRSLVDVAHADGTITAHEVERSEHFGDRVCAMVFRLRERCA
jgi:four helix bundle protein